MKFEEVVECSVDNGETGFILGWVTEDLLVRLVHLHLQRSFTNMFLEIAGTDVRLQHFVLFYREDFIRILLQILGLVKPCFLLLWIFISLLLASHLGFLFADFLVSLACILGAGLSFPKSERNI